MILSMCNESFLFLCGKLHDMNFLKYKIMSFLFLGCVVIHASDNVIADQSSFAPTVITTDQIFLDNEPDAKIHIKRDYQKFDTKYSFYPSPQHPSTKEYVGYQAVMVNNLCKVMDLLVRDMRSYQRDEDDFLREISRRNSKTSDLYLEGRLIPGSTKFLQTAKLRIVPVDDIDLELFRTRVARIIPRFKARGFDLEIEIAPSHDAQA